MPVLENYLTARMNVIILIFFCRLPKDRSLWFSISTAADSAEATHRIPPCLIESALMTFAVAAKLSLSYQAAFPACFEDVARCPQTLRADAKR